MSEESSNSTDDAKNARNLQLEEFNLRMHLQQNNISPNDYLWQPCFNDVLFQNPTLEEDTDRPQSTPQIVQPCFNDVLFQDPKLEEDTDLAHSTPELTDRAQDTPEFTDRAQSTPKLTDRAQCTPAISECPPSISAVSEIDIKKFPNPRSEQIYHYVVDVLDCYERRKTQYVQNRVFPHLESYRDKANAVEVALVGNVLRIRDKLDYGYDLESLDNYIGDLSTDITALLVEFTKEWVKCIESFACLKEIKTKMLQCRFDRETLRLAKRMAMKLVASLKKAHKMLHHCLNKVKELYDFLNDI